MISVADLDISHARLLAPGHQVDVDPLTLLELARHASRVSCGPGVYD